MTKNSDNNEFLASWTPEIILSLSKNYGWNSFFCDIRAGLLVAVVAFPLFMTFAIASGVAPNIGITTCIVAGTIACLFGGAKFQIVGPTGAFAMIVYDIIANKGFEGMTCALIMAGIMMIIFGITKIGDLIHYVPYPITAGFTAGIGLSIIVSQLSAFLGLHLDKAPTNFVERIVCCATNIDTINSYSFTLAIFSLAILVLIQKYKPKLPGYFLVLIISVLYSVFFADKGIETIGSKFGDISNASLLNFSVPSDIFSFANLRNLFSSAFAIAFLGSLESLLGAVISDNLSGQKHRSNMELVGQGLANLGSAIFGGIPATCALGTTSLNVKVGAKSPVAGLFNVLFLTMFVICLGRFIKIVPLSALAAMLMYTAWNMASFKKNKYILLAPKSDSFVFIATILITLLVDIVAAVEVGIVLSAFLFIRRSVETTTAEVFDKTVVDNDHSEKSCECVRICGHLFFGAAPILNNALKTLPKTHEAIYIDMSEVPFVDVSGAKVLKDFVSELKIRNIRVIIGGLNRRTQKALKKMDLNHELQDCMIEN
ncbi:MAG: STAS domain-containing protein [Alphaproteobacteria bacterium]|nr:STAS domain-containing protein [Alphaproteobacteria bacterium]